MISKQIIISYVHTLLFAVLLVGVSPVYAQSLTVLQPLSFGKIVMLDFNAVTTITINAQNGNFTNDANTLIIDPPQRGEFLISSPANTGDNYTVTIPSSLTLSGPGGTFLLDNLVIKPNNLKTDNAGDDTFFIGGRLTSQGGGVNYGDGQYSQGFTVIVAF